MNRQLFFNARFNKTICLSSDGQGLYQLPVGDRIFHVSDKALEFLNYQLVSTDVADQPRKRFPQQSTSADSKLLLPK
ncbi:MAG: hypothetical protein AAFY78_01245 [Cyanobacteria bacterium J06648_16]